MPSVLPSAMSISRSLFVPLESVNLAGFFSLMCLVLSTEFRHEINHCSEISLKRIGDLPGLFLGYFVLFERQQRQTIHCHLAVIADCAICACHCTAGLECHLSFSKGTCFTTLSSKFVQLSFPSCRSITMSRLLLIKQSVSNKPAFKSD